MSALIISLIMALGTVAGRIVSRRTKLAMRTWCLGVALTSVLVFLFFLMNSLSGVDILGAYFRKTGLFSILVSNLSVGLAILILLITALLDDHSVRLQACMWNCSMLCLAGYAGTETVELNLLAVGMSIYPLLLYGRESKHWLSFLKAHPDLVVGLILFVIGAAMHVNVPGHTVTGLIGTAILITSLSLVIRSLPYPRLKPHSSTDSPVLSLIGLRLIPAVTSSVALWNLGMFQPFTRQQSFLLMEVSAVCLFMLGLRLWNETQISRRIIALCLSMFHFSVFIVVLQSWQLIYPERNWLTGVLLPSPFELFGFLLASEVVAILLIVTGQRLLQKDPDSTDHHESIAGVGSTRPFASIPFVLGLCSITGIPPLAGCWWRLLLIAAWLLPAISAYRNESENFDFSVFFISLTIVMALLFQSLGGLSELRRIFLSTPLRIRKSPVLNRTLISSVILVVTLGLLSFFPSPVLNIFQQKIVPPKVMAE